MYSNYTNSLTQYCCTDQISKAVLGLTSVESFERVVAKGSSTWFCFPNKYCENQYKNSL